MDEDIITAIIEQLNPEKMDQSFIEELIMALKNVELPQNAENEITNGITVEELKAQIEKEPDYRKRASLAARIISLGLST